MNSLKKIELKVKDTFFYLFQLFLKKGKVESGILDGRNLRNILLLRPDRIGDTVCSFPLIDSLLKSFPQIKISIFASSKNYPLIKDDPRFERIFIYRRNIFRDINEILRIRRAKFECVVDLLADDSVTTLFLSQVCAVGAPRIGLGKRKFEKFYDFNYAPESDCRAHTIDINLKLLDAFGSSYQIAERHAPPYVDRQTDNRIVNFLKEAPAGKIGTPVIGFNLSARGENREWGYEKSRQLISKILEEFKDCLIILISVPSERFKGERLEALFDGRVIQSPPNAGLTEISALLSKLDILISPDTSLVHIARSYRIPVVGLYAAYKEVYRQWRPFNQEDGLVLSYGGDNIFNINVEQVFEEFSRIMRKERPILS